MQFASSDADRSDRQKGLAFIISNKASEDDGSIHEEYGRKMEDLWRNKIGCDLFNGKSYSNVSGRQMKRCFKSLAEMDAKDFQYLVVVITARGGLMESRSVLGDCKFRDRFDRACKWFTNRLPTNKTYSTFFFGSDGKSLSEEKMLSYFYNDNSSWKNKPKFFILNYCRMNIAEIRDQLSEPQGGTAAIEKSNPKLRVTPPTTSTRYPTISDFVLTYGTSLSTSCLLDAIDSVFSNHWQTKSLSSLLTMVNNRIRSSRPTRRKCVFESSLGKPLMLFQDAEPGVIVETQPLQSQPQVPIMIQDMANQIRDGTILRNGTQLELQLVEMIRSYMGNQETMEAIQANPPLQTASKGRVLIISNALNQNSRSHLDDSNTMTELWKKTLGCDLHQGTTFINKTATEMKEIIAEFASTDSGQYKYAAIVISSHGGLKKKRIRSGRRPFQPRVSCPCFLGTDDELIDEREILSIFNGDESTWHGKVKIFILDYCRGGRVDHGVAKAAPFSTADRTDEAEDDQYEIDETFLPPVISSMIDDSFLMYATHAGYVAYSTFLIDAVSKEFSANWRAKSVAEMLTLVNGRMKEKTAQRKDKKAKAMSVFKSTVTEDFYLCKRVSV